MNGGRLLFTRTSDLVQRLQVCAFHTAQCRYCRAVAPGRGRRRPGLRGLLGDKAQPSGESRPLENASPPPIAAAIALEMIGPMPGTLIKRSQPASWRARTDLDARPPRHRLADHGNPDIGRRSEVQSVNHPSTMYVHPRVDWCSRPHDEERPRATGW